MATDPLVSGHCDGRFTAVREEFVRNFEERGDVGAAVCVMIDGQPVVNLVGGWQDQARERPWDERTVVNVWSSTKGVAAACFAMIVDRGLVRYDQPVADFWPEFAAHGKDAVTVAMLLSHQAGLCGFADPATVSDLLAGEASAARLAGQAPLWPPGTASGYHAISVGILATALFERIEGRSLRRFVAEELAAERQLDIMIGLPSKDDHRRAEMVAPPEMSSASIGSLTPPQIAALANPPLDPLLPNEAIWREADVPSANGHSNAGALAGLYATLVGGALVGTQTLAEATKVRIGNVDLVLGIPVQWAAGFLLNTDGVYGPSRAAFGHSGWGGSFAFGDPATGLSMSYTMNRMGTMLRDDPRDVALIEAAYRSLG